MSEKRTLKRVQLEVPLTLGENIKAISKDVSTGGFCAKLKSTHIPGMYLSGTFLFEGKELPFVGELAWARAVPQQGGGCYVGIRFKRIPEEILKLAA
jgi:hypothetical protein